MLIIFPCCRCPLNVKISQLLLLLGKLTLHKVSQSRDFFLKTVLKLHEALLILDIDTLPQDICCQCVHKACLILKIGRKSPELLVDFNHFLIN
jgi:hypothetical protein